MQNSLDLEKTIDKWNEEFTSNARRPLQDLSAYSTESLEWLMMEHFQFSFNNCQFLLDPQSRPAGLTRRRSRMS